MRHPEPVGFFKTVLDANKTFLEGASVLENWGVDVNGTVRRAFAAAGRYVGVGLVEGPGVDVVRFGHEVDHSAARPAADPSTRRRAATRRCRPALRRSASITTGI
jgi:hypothetical protein